MKKISLILIFLTNLICSSIAQNVSIGNAIPTIARFEVSGADGVGRTSAIFTPGDFVSSNTAISIQRDPATIGFNQYQDAQSGNGRYIGTGYACTISLANGLEIKQFSPGVFGAPTNNSTIGFRLGNSMLNIGNVVDWNTRLRVTRNTSNTNGTAMFSGSQNISHFHFGVSEDTYIRSGKNGGAVIINNHGNSTGALPNIGRVLIKGKVSIGLGGSIEPDLSLQINGAMAFNKHIYHDVINNSTVGFNGFVVNNANIITVTNSSANTSPSMYLSTVGCTEGQILILHNATNNELSTIVGYIPKNESVLLMYKLQGRWERF